MGPTEIFDKIEVITQESKRANIGTLSSYPSITFSHLDTKLRRAYGDSH